MVNKKIFPNGIKPPKPGIYKGVSYAEYDQWACFHKSLIGPTLRSYKALVWSIENPYNSEFLDFGLLVDNLLLEPDDPNFEVLPETYTLKNGSEKPFPKTGNLRNETCAEIRGRGKIPCSTDEYTNAVQIVNNIHNHPMAAKWLSKGEAQVSIVWDCPQTGLRWKGRFDWLTYDMILDLKITTDPLPYAFRRIADRFKYHAQAAAYHDGWCTLHGVKIDDTPSLPFGFIVAGTEREMDVMTYQTTPEQFEAGREICRRASELFLTYLDSDIVGGHSSVAEDLPISDWSVNRVLLEGIIE